MTEMESTIKRFFYYVTNKKNYRSCWVPDAADRAESCSIALSVLPSFRGLMDEEVKRRARKSMGRPTLPALLLLFPGSPRPCLSSLPSPHPPLLPPHPPPQHRSSFPVMWTAGEQGCWSPPERCPCLPLLLFLHPRPHLSRSRQAVGHMMRWGRGLHRSLMHLWAAHSSRQNGRHSSCNYLAHSEAVEREINEWKHLVYLINYFSHEVSGGKQIQCKHINTILNTSSD